MKCAKCGSELQAGKVYCPVCGAEAVVVPDYSVLEDDYLRTLIKEKEKPEAKRGSAPMTGAAKKNSRLPLIVVCVLLLAGIGTGVAVKISVDRKHAGSYDYQMAMAEQAMAERDSETALRYYNTAMALAPTDIAVRLALADIYHAQKDYDAAIELLQQARGLDAANRAVYERLIAIYEEQKDYESLLALADDATDASLAELFAPYLVSDPVISPVSGLYHKATDVVIVSLDGCEIYYTTDGSDPDTGSLRYEDDISLKDPGTYEIRAVCANEKGILSEIVSASYEIEYLPPDYADVYPDGGRITEETFVTITAKDGCDIYYTWDGTDPARQSARYTEPLEIPVGNTVLSVLVIDPATGLESGIYRTNFIYYP